MLDGPIPGQSQSRENMTCLVRIYLANRCKHGRCLGAKARMSELIKCVQSQPQDITVHGKSVAVVMVVVVVSRETFDRLTQTQGS